MRAVVGRVEDDRVVRDAEVVERLEQLADVAIVLDHAIGIFGPGGQPWLVAMLRPHVRARVHPGVVEPAEERLAGRDLPFDVVDRRVRRLVVDRLHAFPSEVRYPRWSACRPGPTSGPPWIVHVGSLATQHAARAELLPKARVSRVVEVLGLLLGIEVVEIAEELVEPMHGRQVFILVAEVVLPNWPVA